MQIGQVEVHLLSDGISWSDGGGAFGLVPRTLWDKILPPDALNRVPLILNCLLIRSQGKTILVETGLGDKLTDKQCHIFGLDRPNGGLLDSMARLGVTPEEIDIVINTHLHADHCGGNTILQDGNVVAAFPNAEYWVQRLEWADANFPNERTRATYLPQNFLPLQATDQLHLTNGDTRVTADVRTVVTPGHTRAHQSVVIESEGEAAFFTGDMATLSIHFERLAWVTAYDVEPLETIETKRRWQRWALEQNALIISAHDPHKPVARLQETEGKMQLESVSSAPTQR